MRNLVIYFRFLSRHKTLSAINILGLSIGIAMCLFIGLYIREELSYDRYHAHIDRLFVVSSAFTLEGSDTRISTGPSALATDLKQHFPEVEDAVRMRTLHNQTVRYGEKLFKEENMYEGDAAIFNVLSYPLTKGNPATALTSPGSIVMVESMARKYFGDEDPINKILTINGKEFQVTGVMQELPSHSDLTFSALISLDRSRDDDWGDFNCYTYVLFHDNYLRKDPELTSVKKKLAALVNNTVNEKLRIDKESVRVSLPIEPLSGVHFRQPTYDDTPKGSMSFIYIIASIALLVLLIASLNFINFSLVQSLERGREVGIRKIAGAKYYQLVFRYLGESILTALFALALAVVAAIFLIPLFNRITGKDFLPGDILNFSSTGFALLTTIVVGVLAGSFPAFFTSSIRPLQSLKGKITGLKGAAFRKVSIFVQFAIAIALIITTQLIRRQMNFMTEYDLGFRKENAVVIDTPADSVTSGSMDVLKAALLQNTNIKKVSLLGRSAIPGEYLSKSTVAQKEDGESKVTNVIAADEDYLSTLDIKLVLGRNFNGSSSDAHAVIVNESFVKAWGWTDPLAEHILGSGIPIKVIGVVKDFHFLSLHNAIEPVMFFQNKRIVDNVVVRFDASCPVSTQTEILHDAWSKVFPNEPFVSHFLDQSIAAQYINDERASSLFTIFSVLAIAVSCLGLFGLCSLGISQRKREVGIRKVVGAGFRSIVYLFSKEYMVLICCAFVITVPIAFLFIDHWLASFPFRQDISAWSFITAGLGAALAALFTIVVSITKTSSASPADLIRE